MWCLRMSQLRRNDTESIFFVYFCIQGLHERMKYRSTDITMVIAVVIKYLSFWKSSLVRVCAA